MASNVLLNEFLTIYNHIITENVVSEESQRELSNFFKNWEAEPTNLDDYSLNLLILNLINYIEFLECPPMIYILIKEIKIKIFGYFTENLPIFSNEIKYNFSSKIDYTKMLAEVEHGGIIYEYYRPVNKDDFCLPPYGTTSLLNVSFIGDDNKNYKQQVKINHAGRVLSIIGNPVEEIDFTQLSSDDSNSAYDELYQSLIDEVLSYKEET